jgi:RNA polymerase sigma factor (TIGR02999 family)
MNANLEAEITDLLQSWSAGNRDAEEKLWPLVFAELKRLARRHLAHQRYDHTLQSAGLLNEVYMRLTALKNTQWESRAKFFAMCSRMMRQILVDHARARHSLKRDGSASGMPLDEIEFVSESKAIQLLALHDALEALARIHPRKSEVVEMRFFGGHSMDEIAEIMNVSRLTVIRDWNFARAWLGAAMNGKHIDEA